MTIKLMEFDKLSSLRIVEWYIPFGDLSCTSNITWFPLCKNVICV